MPTDEARRRFAAAAVARLATVDAAGRPHLVPITFALEEDTLYSAVDAKPKSTNRLKRLANIAANPAVTLLVDYYEDDWTALWWVRADGRARVERTGPAAERAREVLAGKYRQYQATPPTGPVIVVTVTHWRAWSAAE